MSVEIKGEERTEKPDIVKKIVLSTPKETYDTLHALMSELVKDASTELVAARAVFLFGINHMAGLCRLVNGQPAFGIEYCRPYNCVRRGSSPPCPIKRRTLWKAVRNLEMRGVLLTRRLRLPDPANYSEANYRIVTFAPGVFRQLKVRPRRVDAIESDRGHSGLEELDRAQAALEALSRRAELDSEARGLLKAIIALVEDLRSRIL